MMSFPNEESLSKNFALENRSSSDDAVKLRAISAAPSQNSTNPRVLPAGLWLRQVMGFEAPFGHDGLPTVWG